MDHMKDNERATNGREHEDDYMHKIFLAAGTTLAMACLKRVLVMFFVEQWRIRVFLVLNLVLLAIFLTSIRSSSSENQEIDDDDDDDDDVEMKVQEKKRRKECDDRSAKVKAHKECHKLGKGRKDAQKVEPDPEEEQSKVDSAAHKLSKEELNERVEAFIAMFRQHLVSDARKGRY